MEAENLKVSLNLKVKFVKGHYLTMRLGKGLRESTNKKAILRLGSKVPQILLKSILSIMDSG